MAEKRAKLITCICFEEFFVFDATYFFFRHRHIVRRNGWKYASTLATSRLERTELIFHLLSSHLALERPYVGRCSRRVYSVRCTLIICACCRRRIGRGRRFSRNYFKWPTQYTYKLDDVMVSLLMHRSRARRLRFSRRSRWMETFEESLRLRVRWKRNA